MVNTVSCPGFGCRGIISASANDVSAIAAANTKTMLGEVIHKYPSVAGRNTAAIWLIVNETAAVGAISLGSAIFWKYVRSAKASAKNKWSIT